jgi:radical SAM superfamily enzyme YgiQ (UPF0313 family)
MLAAVTPGKINTRIIYETVETIPFEEQWDLVGITGMGSGTYRAWQIGDAFRERGVKVVIGGVGPSLFDPEITLMHADSIVVGEAEEIWPRVIEDFLKGKLQRKYKQTDPPDLSRLPAPRYDLMNLSRMGFMRSVQATRGCPFSCSFCSVGAFANGIYRKKPVELVIRDVRAAKKTGSRYFVFIDDNLFFDIDYDRQLMEALIPEKIIWISSSTIHISDHPQMLDLAHRSGCRMLSVGLESLDRQTLVEMKKHWNFPDLYGKAITTLREHGIMCSTSVMVGLDSDDTGTFDRVYNFIMDNYIPVPRVLIFTPIPGTPVYSQLLKEKRIIDNDLGKYTGGNVVFQPRNMKPEELQEGYWTLYSRLFRTGNIFRRISKNIIGQSPLIVAALIVTNFNYQRHLRHRIVPGIT